MPGGRWIGEELRPAVAQRSIHGGAPGVPGKKILGDAVRPEVIAILDGTAVATEEGLAVGSSDALPPGREARRPPGSPYPGFLTGGRLQCLLRYSRRHIGAG